MEKTIDMKELWNVFRKHLFLILTVTVITTVIGFMLATFIVSKKYSATVMLYVESKDSSATESTAVTQSEINAAIQLANTCSVIFKSNTMLTALKEECPVDYTVAQLSSMFTVSSVNNTQVMKVVVTAKTAEDAQAIANGIADVSGEVFKTIIKNGSIEIVDYATLNKNPVYPSKQQFTIIGFGLGLIASYLFALVFELFNVTIKTDDDLFSQYEIPVFAEIVDFEVKVKGSYSNE